ncbi:hypothetical protein Glove_114g157 [Diversispora epigaea]|uniref:Uncharacterized protein n=1 Tax=Diversispora epigaea TaxID=1348612 RepID=A0A397JB83_9GLOM|nr:hypothetical protein Glove_114g157 [Diversispora epigaea]
MFDRVININTLQEGIYSPLLMIYMFGVSYSTDNAQYNLGCCYPHGIGTKEEVFQLPK